MLRGVFGDSYDIVKKSLLSWLREFGDWSVHPMFTEEFSEADLAAYQALLGARVVSTDVLGTRTDRRAYLARATSCGHLFLDPDKGLSMRSSAGRESAKYLFARELVWLVEGRPTDVLTMVFDQSLPRGDEESREAMERKLRSLRQDGVFGFAYVSHASFIVAGRDQSLVESSCQHILAESHLPQTRLLQGGACDR